MLHNDIGMEEDPENGKESSHSAHADGMNEWMYATLYLISILHGHLK
jgi:hypothetical protein